jgi:hypothetical protein
MIYLSIMRCNLRHTPSNVLRINVIDSIESIVWPGAAICMQEYLVFLNFAKIHRRGEVKNIPSERLVKILESSFWPIPVPSKASDTSLKLHPYLIS